MRAFIIDHSAYRVKCETEARENRAHWAANRPQTLSDDYLYLRHCPWPTDALESTVAADTAWTIGGLLASIVVGAILAKVI